MKMVDLIDGGVDDPWQYLLLSSGCVAAEDAVDVLYDISVACCWLALLFAPALDWFRFSCVR